MVPKSETLAHAGVETPPPPPDESPKNHSLSTLGRQSSIYSLTLDEFQHNLCDKGKTFCSMTMEELLTNIWTAEENQAIHSNNETSGTKTLLIQSSLPRQGCLTLPAHLCRKTVEEVWSEIQNDQQQQPNNERKPGTNNRQSTLGEMRLEDFLIRAGVVREACGSSSYQNNNTIMDPKSGTGPVMGLGFSDHRDTGNGVSDGIPAYQTFPQIDGVVSDSSKYAGNGKTNSGYSAAQTLGMGSPPVTPLSSDGIYMSQVDNSGSQNGMKGSKRMINSSAEKVMERKQRRMIKNREAAARCRARKEAYAEMLEAELKHLKKENSRLRQALAEVEEKMEEDDWLRLCVLEYIGED